MAPPSRLRRLRVSTLNLWNLNEPWTRRRALVMTELRRLRPDVVALQEVADLGPDGYNQARDFATANGLHFAYAPAGPYRDGTIGNAVLSRYPITRAITRTLPFTDGTLGRIALRTDIDLFEGRLAFFSTHLSYRADESFKREAQVAALDRFIREADRDLPRIVVGDFNADPDSTEIRFLTGRATIAGASACFQDAAAIRGRAEATWTERNPFTEPFYEGERRIDYIFVSHARSDGCGVVASCSLAFDTRDEDGCFASDHLGLVADVWVGPRTATPL